ncbi:hypothetical protein T484DRAFT_1983491 [Baffinella frigidus]|nr:hypothetical protein T484DRAFT_1983491 [Cryptophyta sp. CCMP2293]
MICLGEMADGELASTLVCEHVFHHECISKWLQTKVSLQQVGTCPNCNRHILYPAWHPGTDVARSTRRGRRRSADPSAPPRYCFSLRFTARERRIFASVVGLILAFFFVNFIMNFL